MNSTENGLQNRERFCPRNNPIRAVREHLYGVVGLHDTVRILASPAFIGTDTHAGKNALIGLVLFNHIMVIGNTKPLAVNLDRIDGHPQRVTGLALRFLCDRPSVPRHQERSNRNGKCQRRQNKVPIHHFTSNGARPRSTSALTCKSSASSFISFALKAIRPVHFCETVDREQRNISATSACVRPLSPIRRLTFSPTVGESTKMFVTLTSNHEYS